MPDNNLELVKELNRMKALFQGRAVATAMGLPKAEIQKGKNDG